MVRRTSCYLLAGVALAALSAGPIRAQVPDRRCAPLGPLDSNPANYSWRDNRCEGLVAQQDPIGPLELTSLMLTGLPRPKATYTLTWPVTPRSASVTIRIRSRSPFREPPPAARPLPYHLDAVSTTDRFAWPTTLIRTLGIGQSNDIGVRALAMTTETIGGQARRVYLPVDLAQDLRRGFGLYSLYFTGASTPTEEITFTAARILDDGDVVSDASIPLTGFGTKDGGRLGELFQRLDLSKQPEGLYRVQMQAKATLDKQPVTGEFFMRHGSTEPKR